MSQLREKMKQAAHIVLMSPKIEHNDLGGPLKQAGLSAAERYHALEALRYVVFGTRSEADLSTWIARNTHVRIANMLALAAYEVREISK